jgi:uncharacterized Zn finger protein
LIRENEKIATGRVDGVIKSLRAEIAKVTSEPAFTSRWDGYAELPDYSHIGELFASLLENGRCDELLELGNELFHLGTAQVEQSSDDDMTLGEIEKCMKIVLAALPRSSHPGTLQIVWYIDREMLDHCRLLGGREEFLSSCGWDEGDWRGAAEVLEGRLAEGKDRLGADGYRHTAEWLVETYRRAGLRDKIIPLLEMVADSTGLYEELVKNLIRAGERDRAREWAIRGYKKSQASNYWAGNDGLRDLLRDMAAMDDRRDLVVSYRVDDFLENPSLSSYSQLKAEAGMAGCWGDVREAALWYLESGNFVHKETGTAPDLPPTDVADVKSSRKRRRISTFPIFGVLIDIAISEKRTDDIVELYKRQRSVKTQNFYDDKLSAIADAVQATHPDVSIEIWREIADGLIAEVKPKAYRGAAPYLKKMHDTYANLNRLGEWQALLSELRSVHRTKKRLMEVLDKL